jgi:hypothetical protein
MYLAGLIVMAENVFGLPIFEMYHGTVCGVSPVICITAGLSPLAVTRYRHRSV